MKCGVCEFSKEDLIYETKYWDVIFSIMPAHLGRCIVVLKRHCGGLKDLSEEEWLDFQEIIKKMENSLKKSFGTTVFNWFCNMNDAFKNKPYNPHIHWHILTRYDHDVEIDGFVFTDPDFGHFPSDIDRKMEVSEEVKQKIISKIKENL